MWCMQGAWVLRSYRSWAWGNLGDHSSETSSWPLRWLEGLGDVLKLKVLVISKLQLHWGCWQQLEGIGLAVVWGFEGLKAWALTMDNPAEDQRGIEQNGQEQDGGKRQEVAWQTIQHVCDWVYQWSWCTTWLIQRLFECCDAFKLDRPIVFVAEVTNLNIGSPISLSWRDMLFQDLRDSTGLLSSLELWGGS
jgi:hypothetical protein